MNDWKGEFVIVDGLQRITACMDFMAGELRAFGCLCDEFAGPLPSMAGLRFNVNNLKTRREVLQWYLDINAGGIIHSEAELDRVRLLLAQE